MAVEFALRPRISLERPPRRRRIRFRLPPLALPIAAYWLTIAGVTYGVIRGAANAPTEPEVVRESAGDHPAFEAPAPEPPKEALEAAATPPEARDLVAEPLPVPSIAQSEPEEPSAPEPRNDEAPVVAQAPQPRAQEALPHNPPTERRELRESEPKRAPVSAPRELPPPLPRQEIARAPASERVALAPEAPTPSSVGLPSCESAAESARETIEIGRSRGAPDLSRDAFAAVLENGAYLGRCAIPERTALEICAAVQDGKVIGVTVRAEPQSSTISNCMRRAVAGLRFPRNSRLDVTRTRFEAVR